MIYDKSIKNLLEEVKLHSLDETADQLVLTDASGDQYNIDLSAKVTCDNGNFHFELRFVNQEFPEPIQARKENWFSHPGTVSKSDCWALSGKLSSGLRFEAPLVFPPSSIESCSSRGGTVPLCCHNILLPIKRTNPKEFAAAMQQISEHFTETPDEINEGIKNVALGANTIENTKEANEEMEAPPEPIWAHMTAILPGVSGIFRNSSSSNVFTHPYLGTTRSFEYDCYFNTHKDYEYSLQPHDGDLYVFLRRQRESNDETYEDEIIAADSRLFRALLNSIGFTHGVHPWPFYLEHRFRGGIVKREIKAYSPLDQTALRPFTNSRIKQDLQTHSLIDAASTFFLGEPSLTEQVLTGLWLVREAGKKGVPAAITILTYCSVIEGLLSTLCESDKESAESKAFQSVKDAALNAIGALDTPSDPMRIEYYNRLSGYLKSWGHLHAREKWQTVCKQLSLPWEEVFEPAFKDFRNYRNPLAHGFKEAESHSGGELKALGRLAGALNILIARMMGYSGKIDISIFGGLASAHL